MTPLQLVRLPDLMKLGQGSGGVTVALIDGPVILDHPDFAGSTIREIPGKVQGACARADSVACTHGTFVAGMLSARRGSVAPAICPGCTLLIRPIFPETSPANGAIPSATPEELAEAIADCTNAGARIINLSAALVQPSLKGARQLQAALDYAAGHGAISVAAAGNQGTLGSSVITRHPSVIPVAACDLRGSPLRESNLGSSIGTRGLMAPGEGITGLGTNGNSQTLGGTSAAAPFVTGTIALLWSGFPRARASQIRLAVTRTGLVRRRAIAPPLLDAWAAYQILNSIHA